MSLKKQLRGIKMPKHDSIAEGCIIFNITTGQYLTMNDETGDIEFSDDSIEAWLFDDLSDAYDVIDHSTTLLKIMNYDDLLEIKNVYYRSSNA